MTKDKKLEVGDCLTTTQYIHSGGTAFTSCCILRTPLAFYPGPHDSLSDYHYLVAVPGIESTAIEIATGWFYKHWNQTTNLWAGYWKYVGKLRIPSDISYPFALFNHEVHPKHPFIAGVIEQLSFVQLYNKKLTEIEWRITL